MALTANGTHMVIGTRIATGTHIATGVNVPTGTHVATHIANGTYIGNGTHVKVTTGQSLENPDNEPQYYNVLTSNWEDKSMILMNVGPAEANSRFFDWDQSCTDAGQRERIVLAWRDMQPLITSSSARLQALTNRLPKQPSTNGKDNPANRAFIKSEDPAYTQMFGARDSRLQYVDESYDLITNNVKNFAGRGALRFICNADDHVKNGEGASFCG
jgi:hypothetical protein